MKLACVVHRFGADIAGGSEAHCRALALRLAADHDVTVLTTTAKSHLTWDNTYHAGESRDGRARVLRFPVAQPRNLRRFIAISDVLATGQASLADQEAWFRENGPDAPGLLRHLHDQGATYDRVLFWAYRYAPTYFGLPLVSDRAVLVPTAESDFLINASTLRRFFSLASACLFLTPEEAALVDARADRLPPCTIIGSGVDPAPATTNAALLAQHGITSPFILYLGRIDPNKGCEILLRHFRRYCARGSAPVQLVLAGPANMVIPADPAIRTLGFVGTELRDALLAHARVLVVPSPYESLSLVLLEAWNHAVPALVNGRCPVLRGQVLRANGGLYYRYADEFTAALHYLLAHPSSAERLGAQGLAYVNRDYRWPSVINKLNTFLESLPAHRAPLETACP